MAGLLRLELSRSLRDLRYVVLALLSPVGFYLLFAGIFSSPQPPTLDRRPAGPGRDHGGDGRLRGHVGVGSAIGHRSPLG